MRQPPELFMSYSGAISLKILFRFLPNSTKVIATKFFAWHIQIWIASINAIVKHPTIIQFKFISTIDAIKMKANGEIWHIMYLYFFNDFYCTESIPYPTKQIRNFDNKYNNTSNAHGNNFENFGAVISFLVDLIHTDQSRVMIYSYSIKKLPKATLS